MSFFYGDIKSDELKTSNGLEITSIQESNDNAVTLGVDPSIGSNYDLRLPASLGSVGHVLKVSDATGNLAFAAESGGGSLALDDITAGDAESTLTTTTGKIIINPQANDLEMNVPTANKISLQVNSGEKMFVDTNSANIAVATGITSSLDVSGAVDLGSTLDVTGATTINNNLTTTGVFTLGAGENEFTITESTDDITIKNTIANKDIIFNINNGSDTELLRLDGSATSMLVASGNKIEFRDTTSYINSSEAAKLDLNSTTVSITGALTTSSTANIGGNSNITGSLDVTGDVNLRKSNLLFTASNGNAITVDVDPSIAANYNLRLPASLGSVGHVLKVSDATGNLAFAAESGGGSSALDDITAGDAESTLTTTTGKIIINPQANDLEMNVPTANKISLQVNSGEKMFIDTNSANIAVATGITSSLDVSGAVDLGSTLDVTGATTINNNLTTTGVFTLGAGENEFTITESTDDITIKNTVADKDIIFNINDSDNGGDRELFRLDGSASSMLIAGTNKIEFLDSTSYINSSATQNLDLSSQNINITATQTDVSGALEVTGATTVNNNLTTSGVFTLGAGKNEFTITENSDDITIRNTQIDKDIIFNINDNTEDKEVFRLDGSAASMVINGDKKIEFRDTTSYINSSATQNLDLSSQNINITATQTDVSGALEVTGATTITNATQATSTSTGALIVTGGVGVGKNLHVAGTLDVTNDITASSNIDVTGNVNVSKNVEISGNFNASNTFSLDQGAITITSTSTQTLNLSERSDFLITFDGNEDYTLTLEQSNANKVGQQGSIIITQSGGTNTLTWQTSNGWYFPSATAPTLSSGSGVYDVFSYLVIASDKVLVMDATNFQAYT